jgi:hypothetical protein
VLGEHLAVEGHIARFASMGTCISWFRARVSIYHPMMYWKAGTREIRCSDVVRVAVSSVATSLSPVSQHLVMCK